MRRDTRVQIIAGVLMLAFLFASGVLAVQISSSTGRNRLVYADTAEAGDPPQVALGIAMGAFRGMFVNFLWIRANNLKEDGKYYEAVDLARAITRLQPRFPKVWQFHAWNLAYNISVATQTPEERWQWVQSGIHLLRDEGIPANPNDLGIHKELAWILLHKVQGYMDDAHSYYKRRFATEWTYVLGRPPTLKLGEMGLGTVKDAFIKRWMQPIADAPDTIEELFAQHPGAKALVDAIKTQAGLDLDIRLLQRFEETYALVGIRQSMGVSAPGLAEDPLAAIIADPRFSPEDGKAVLNFVRRRVLVNDYKMEPERMIRYMREYGPLDWRLPAAHALYWSARGVEESLLRVTKENRSDYDILNTDRLTIQAVQELFRTGSLYFDVINPDFYMTLPNTEYIDVYRNILTKLVARSKFDDKSRPYKFYWAGYENFMRDAIRFLYRRGDIEAATRYQKALYEDPDLNTNNPYLYKQLSQPLEDFVNLEITENDRTTNPTVALQEIAGSLQNAFVAGLLAGNAKVFENEFNYARVFHEKYQQTQKFQTWVAGEKGRMGFPEFDVFAAQVFAGLIEAAGIPQGPEMFRAAPADLQARTYAYLERTKMRLTMDEDARHGAPGFNTWFPEPPGIGLYRLKLFGSDKPPETGRTELK